MVIDSNNFKVDIMYDVDYNGAIGKFTIVGGFQKDSHCAIGTVHGIFVSSEPKHGEKIYYPLRGFMLNGEYDIDSYSGKIRFNLDAFGAIITIYNKTLPKLSSSLGYSSLKPGVAVSVIDYTVRKYSVSGRIKIENMSSEVITTSIDGYSVFFKTDNGEIVKTFNKYEIIDVISIDFDVGTGDSKVLSFDGWISEGKQTITSFAVRWGMNKKGPVFTDWIKMK
jgi:hypothetical protein